MSRFGSVLVVALACAPLCLTACGDVSAPSTPSTPAARGTTQPASSPAIPKSPTPEQLGDRISATYVGSMQAVTKLLESKPDADAALPQVHELKERTIQKLVEMGRQREAMSVTERIIVDQAIQAALMNTAREGWYKTYGDLSTYYFEKQDFHRVLVSFNIIGQYANFDLLKTQEPEEATRLGVK